MKKTQVVISRYIIPLIIIIILVMWNISSNRYPKIFGDEYGYWGAGAWFAGLDWNDITSMNEYYGWGYGIILSVILRCKLSAKACYMVAIILNGIMLWGSYCIAYYLSRKLLKNEEGVFHEIVGLVAALLPSALYYTNFSSAEVILNFFYWLLVLAEYKLIKDYSVRNVLLIAVIDAGLISVHFRTVGIIFISIILVIICGIKKKKITNFCQIMLFAVTLFAGFILVFGLKNAYQGNIALEYTQNRDLNSVSGQVYKIRSFFSLDGFLSFMSNLFGRIYTLFSNTYLIAGYAILMSFVCFFKGGKNKQAVEYLSIVCVLNTLSVVIISALYMIYAESTRFDILIYSRYHEFSVGILLLLGILYLKDNRISWENHKKMAFICCVLAVCLAKMVTAVIAIDSSTSNLFINNPLIYYWSLKTDNLGAVFAIAVLSAILLFMVLFLLGKKGKKYMLVVMLIMLVVNIAESNAVYKEGCLSWSSKLYETTEETLDYIISNGLEDSICFFNDDDVLKVDLLQFMLKEHSIHVITREMYSDDGNVTVVTTSNYKTDQLLNDEELIYKSDYLSIWSKQHE